MDETITLELEQRRSIPLELVRSTEGETEELELSFSSETPCRRHWYTEILSHAPGAADLSRADGGACPLLLNHDENKLIGVVDRAWIDSVSRKGRAKVRFAPNEEGLEAKTLVDQGFLKNVSVRYRILDYKEEYDSETSRTAITATSWELIEVSLVTCPEDPTVGIGRSIAIQQPVAVKSTNNQGKSKMDETTDTAVIDKPEQQRSTDAQTRAAVAAERDRVKVIQAMGQRYAARLPGGASRAAKLVEQAIDNGLPEQAARGLFADEILSQGEEPQSISRPAPQLDFSKKEQRNYSLSRAFRVAASRFYPELSIDDCGLEMEASRAIADSIGANPKGLFVPVNDLVINGKDALRGQMLMEGQRASYTAGTANLGGNTIETMLDTTRMIDFLFNAPRTKEAGITMLMGLQGNLDIPTEDGSGLGITWVAEDGSIAETNSTFGLISLRPKTAGAYMRVTQRMMLQSELSIEAYMRSRLQIALALGIDNAVLRGTGLSNQPLGILNTPGVSSVAMGTNGGAPTYSALIDAETLLGDNNMDQLGNGPTWMTNSKVRGVLRKTLENPTSGAGYIWRNGGVLADSEVIGYRALVTNQIPNNLTKGTGTNLSAAILGYWNQVFLGQWGVVDLMPNPYGDTDFVKGAIKIRIMTTLDVLVARAKAFSVFTDLITT